MAKEKLTERIRWWLSYPRFELIYLLGGVPHQHINTLNYRNIQIVVSGLRRVTNQDDSCNTLGPSQNTDAA